MTAVRSDSARKRELLDAAYDYVVEHGLTELSLRPLAEAIGSSPRVLLFLFGSKDGLVQALLARARADELAMLADVETSGGLAEVGQRVWRWLAHPDHRRLLTLWAEGYARSLVNPAGPWADFARRTVADWLGILAAAQPARLRRTARGATDRTLLLAVLRGALLDLLATGDLERTTAAVNVHLSRVEGATRARRDSDPRTASHAVSGSRGR
jgi:AcrR family transcriptional regulator